MYCPKCKTEYEAEIKLCADCQIDLVETLENVVWMKPLIQVKEVEVAELINYLEYSGIKHMDVLEKDGKHLIQVGENEYEQALIYLKVYIQEHMEEADDADYYFDEYTTEIENPIDKMANMKSSVTTFGLLGVGLLIGVGLNYVGLYTLPGFNKVVVLMIGLVLGLGSLAIAIKTKQDMNALKDTIGVKETVLEEMVHWYKKEKGIESFFQRHDTPEEALDEGALYFYISDIIKSELKEKYAEVEGKYINEAVEILSEKIETK